MGKAGWGMFLAVLLAAFIGEAVIHGVFFAVASVLRATRRFGVNSS
jgi:hypothetical protein